MKIDKFKLSSLTDLKQIAVGRSTLVSQMTRNDSEVEIITTESFKYDLIKGISPELLLNGVKEINPLSELFKKTPTDLMLSQAKLYVFQMRKLSTLDTDFELISYIHDIEDRILNRFGDVLFISEIPEIIQVIHSIPCDYRISEFRQKIVNLLNVIAKNNTLIEKDEFEFDLHINQFLKDNDDNIYIFDIISTN